MKSYNKSYLALGIILATFLFLGIKDIGKFETVDEHFWKYDRIPGYWEAWENWNLKKTAVNDKPGITVAFLNGAGLLFADPMTHRIRDNALTQDGDLTLYDAYQAETINTSLRLPGLLVNALILIAIYFISLRVFGSTALSVSLVTFIGLSPILIGITQIMNPDTYLWSFSFSAILMWLWYLKEPDYQKAIVTGLFLGGTILSKYTGLILFPAFFFLLFLLWDDENKIEVRKIWQRIFGFGIATLTALIMLCIFLPAVLVKPKLLWASTLGFFAEQGVLWPLVAIIFIVLTFLFYFPQRVVTVLQNVQKFIYTNAFILVLPVSLLLVATFFFGLGNQSMIPLEAHYLSSKEDETLAFPLLAESTHPAWAFVIKMMVQLYPILFALHPLVIAALGFLFIRITLRQSLVLQKKFSATVILFILWFSAFFVMMNLLAGVLINARYGIVVFPLLYLLAALGVTEFFLWLRSKCPKFTQYSAGLFVIGFLILAINAYQAKPFLFNYTSPLLKKQFVIHDAWGYGLYQAAEYLNALPKEQGPIYVWSDRNGICQFLLPHVQCVSGFKIDKEKYPLSYIVISKRGLERGYKPRYIIPETEKSEQVAEYIGIEKTALWRLDILGRSDNFIMIVPVQQ